MHAKEQTLQQILEGSKQYLIPLYQRTFSWKREQVEQLWRDALAQADAVTSGVSGPGHFLGSLVLAPTAPVAGGVQRWLVVDGQQRLTTLSLALAALRDHVRAEDPKAADRIHRQLLINEFADGPERFKLLPTQGDRPAFWSIIEGDPGEATGNIGDTYRMIRELLVAFDDPEDPYDVLHLEQAMTGQLDLVAITADADDNVHRIFESLNNTGMQLTQGDLLRNYIFMRLPTQAEKAYRHIWQPMEKTLGTDNLETLAYLDLVVQGYEKANRGDTYRLQTERMQSLGQQEDVVIRDLQRLHTRALALAPVLNPSKATDVSLRNALQRLADWGAEATWPVMLVALERWHAGTADIHQVVQCALYLESFMVRRLLVGRTSAGVNRSMIQVANDIRHEDDIAAAVRRSLSTSRRFWATDDHVREGVATRNFYWSGKGSQRMFILRRLEESLGHKEAIDWAGAKPSIEHIMPQSPGLEWLQDLHDPEFPDSSPAEVHQMWVHRLGNLTLTSYNTELSADPFPVKRDRYGQSHFELTRPLANLPAWGVQQIHQRGTELAELIIKVWPGPLDIGPPQADDQWRVVRQLLVAVPEGTWTTYGDVCALAGTHPVALGSFLGGTTTPNAWRVLTAAGRVSEGFRWADDRTETPQEVLERDGVRFDSHGSADPTQRLRPVELAALIGISVPDQTPDIQPVQNAHRAEHFWMQLQAHQTPQITAGVRALAEGWAELGGSLGYGDASQVSLFFLTAGPDADANLWPWVVYPAFHGVIEFVFQHLKIRAPFDDTSLREELRRRLNEVPGIHIDPARIGLRPNAPIEVLAHEAAIDGLLQVAKWFRETADPETARNENAETDSGEILGGE